MKIVRIGGLRGSQIQAPIRSDKKEQIFTKPRGIVPIFASGGFGRYGFWAPTRWTENVRFLGIRNEARYSASMAANS
jgi:hypothetical protein